MSISDAKRKADRKWRENNYDKICIQLPKGTRDDWKQKAAKYGISLAELIRVSVETYMKGGLKNDTSA